jgi:hypothetical protein
MIFSFRVSVGDGLPWMVGMAGVPAGDGGPDGPRIQGRWPPFGLAAKSGLFAVNQRRDVPGATSPEALSKPLP